MATRKIIQYPKHEKQLRKPSDPVHVFNRRVKKLIRDLKDTLLDRPEGIGLAAPQINVHQQVIVVRLNAVLNEEGEGKEEEAHEADPPIALINPEIVEARNNEKDFDGCLSFPGLFAHTVRPHYLRVKALDEQGNATERIFEGFDAVLVHHEIDHLNGVLFIDRLESLNDLYRVERNEKGELVEVPVTQAKAKL